MSLLSARQKVLYKKDEKGKLLEPMETAFIDVPEEFTGIVIEKLGQRKGELRNMGTASGGYTRMEFPFPHGDSSATAAISSQTQKGTGF